MSYHSGSQSANYSVISGVQAEPLVLEYKREIPENLIKPNVQPNDGSRSPLVTAETSKTLVWYPPFTEEPLNVGPSCLFSSNLTYLN